MDLGVPVAGPDARRHLELVHQRDVARRELRSTILKVRRLVHVVEGGDGARHVSELGGHQRPGRARLHPPGHVLDAELRGGQRRVAGPQRRRGSERHRRRPAVRSGARPQQRQVQHGGGRRRAQGQGQAPGESPHGAALQRGCARQQDDALLRLRAQRPRALRRGGELCAPRGQPRALQPARRGERRGISGHPRGLQPRPALRVPAPRGQGARRRARRRWQLPHPHRRRARRPRGRAGRARGRRRGAGAPGGARHIAAARGAAAAHHEGAPTAPRRRRQYRGQQRLHASHGSLG
mmetsp:Transcript_11377/g.34472  ORF Transcript_11377/g.34472 Transcript_11377/m.34472 type:complete len:294 (-) Transcript_11377:633-1514(-)